MYLLLKILTKLMRNIPRKAGYFFFELVGVFKYFFSSKRRLTLKKNLSNVIGKEAPGSMVIEAYKNYSRYYFDLFRTREEMVAFSDGSTFKPATDVITSALETRGGCILVSMHVANWDAGAAFISDIFPGKVSVVVEELSPGVYKWFNERRRERGVEVISEKDLKSMVRALKTGRLLILLGDRDLDKNGFKMDFFGKKAYIPAGPATLALMAKVPVVTAVTVRGGKDKMHFNYVPAMPALNLEPAPRTPENVEKLTKEIVGQMETLVSMHPEQWCMLQQVWLD